MSSKPEERQRLAAKFEDDAEIRTVQPGIVTLNVPEDDGIVIGGGMKKSNSMASLRAKIRDKREKFRQNQCAGMIMFLIFGGILNILAYFASVWSAQLNADVVKAAVENEHALTFKLKKAITEAPSKYLIALLNFGGRVLSAVGTIMLVQVITTYCKRRKQYSILMKSATEEADTAISDAHVDCTDTAGECCLACMQASTIAVHVVLIFGVSIYTLFGALTMQYLESPDRIKTSRVREAKAVKATLYQPPPIKFEEEENKDVAKFVRVYLGSEISEFDPGVRDCLYHVIGNLLKRANCEADKIEEYIEVGNIDRCYEMARISNIPVEKAVTRQPQQTKATTVRQKMTIEEEIQKELNKWNFGNALIFAFTIITTIGYGHVAPVTFYGRLFCIVYGVIGVPFTLLTIADLGMFIMKIIRMIINYIKKGISYVRKLINSRLNPQSDEKSEVIEKWNGDGDASTNTAKEPESVQDEEEEEEHSEQEVKKTVDSIGLGISFTLYMLFGAKILSIYEPEMDFFRALYFNFVTLTTVGLGDFVPKSHDYLIVTLIYIGIGLALTTVAIEIAADLLKKIHYAGRPMENIGNAVVWFGGKRMTMKALVKNLGDKFNIPQEELENLNIDQFVDNAIKVEKGELQTLRKPQSPVVFRDMPRPFSYSILRKSNESATLKWVDERFSKATDLSTVTEDAPVDFIVNEVGSKTAANNKGNRSGKERQKFAVPPLELDIPFLTDSSMPSSFDQDYLQTFTYSKR